MRSRWLPAIVPESRSCGDCTHPALLAILEQSALASFEMAQARLESTLWPDTLRLFPELAERIMGVDPVAMLQRTLAAGVWDEYGLPAFEEVIERTKIKIQANQFRDSNIHLTFPSIVVSDKIHAYRDQRRRQGQETRAAFAEEG